MRINEEKVEAGYDAWDKARKDGRYKVVYGVLHESSGDVVFSWGPNGKLERVVNGGFGLAEASRGDDDRVARAMSQDRFSVVVPASGYDKSKLLRVWPGPSETWSKKSAHPDIGGLGMIGATLLAN